MKLLAEAGLAREVRFGDGVTHYEHNYKHQHHDHMICSECGRIIDSFLRKEAIQDAYGGEAPLRSDATSAAHYWRLRGMPAREKEREKEKELGRVREGQAEARARS